MVDVEAATARGILVTNSPGLNAPAVAEQAVLLMLAVTRGLIRCDRMVRAREDFRNPTVFETLRSPEIGGKLLGLIGFGAVAQNLAQRAQALGMRVCAYKPIRDDALMRRQGVAPESFETLLAASDYVALCCPLTEETRAMIDRNTLKKMKPGSYLINIARGGLIVSEDLAEALAAGHIAGAALDATTPEPPAADDPLLGCENVIFGAHQGGNTHEAWVRMCERAVDNTLEVLAGRYPPHLVNPDALDAYAERFGPLKSEV
jgi:phosphoglycerate dehydrogenase-like enzyme